jgi:prophage antirepressor-like protein
MNNQLQAFAYQDAGEVRTAVIDGQPFFALADVCHCAGIANSRDVAARLRDDEQFEGDFHTVEPPTSGIVTLDIATAGGIQPVTFVSEPHVYSVILLSRKPSAKRFRAWVTRLCHLAGGELEQIQFLLGPVSIQTTERYLGCKQRLRCAVNDRLGIEPDAAA